IPFVSRTRAILRSAEFGFFGVTVATRVQTPRLWGAATAFLRPCPDLRPGVVVFFLGRLRPLRTSWFVFGTAAHGSGLPPLGRGRGGARSASDRRRRPAPRRSPPRAPRSHRRRGRAATPGRGRRAGRRGGRPRCSAGRARRAPGRAAAGDAEPR